MAKNSKKKGIGAKIGGEKSKMQKLKATCEECGLANADNEKEPANPIGLPCRFCRRNGKAVKPVTDFHSETWLLNSRNEPIIEDPDPHEQNILRFLHEIVNLYEPQRG